MGAQQALVVPDQLLGGQPAHALHEATLDLADVDGRVDAAAHVVQDVHGQHPALAREGVDGDLGHRRAIGEVVERPPQHGDLVVVDLGRAVETVAPELDAVGIRRAHHVFPAADAFVGDDLAGLESHRACAYAVQPGHEGRQVLAHLPRGELGRATVQVGAAAGRGGAGVGHLAGVGRSGEHAIEGHAQFIGHDGRDLGVQALAHLGATVVHLHAAVGVDMHQRARLVEQRGGEADAELDRRERDAALDDRAARVPLGDLLGAFAVAAGERQLRHERFEDVVLHRHLVVGDIAFRDAVQVGQPYIERVDAEVACDVAHDAFDDDHPLRAAEAAEGRVALGVGLAAVGVDGDVFEEVGVVGVEDGSVGHRARQVGAEAAVDQHVQLQSAQAAGVVKADAVGVGKRVALAGDHEVVVAVQAQLDRPAELVRSDGGPDRQVPGLRLLAAETAAHAPAFHRDRVVGQAQCVRDPVLHLARVLCAAVHPPLLLFQRQHVGDLAFQVEMFLPADLERAGQRVRRALQRGRRVAAGHVHRRQHIALLRVRLLRREHRLQRLDIPLHQTGRAARGHHVVGHDQAADLAEELHRALSKHGFVVCEGGEQAVAGDVVGPDEGVHARQRQRGGRVDALEHPVRDRRAHWRRVQGAAHLGNVVDVGGGAGHLGARALMEARDTGGRHHGRVVHHELEIRCIHDRASRVLRLSRLMACCPWLSSQKRRSRLPSTVWR